MSFRELLADDTLGPLVVALVGAAALLAGVLLKALFDHVTESGRRQYEHSVRFVEVKREAYVEVYRRTRELADIARRLAEMRIEVKQMPTADSVVADMGKDADPQDRPATQGFEGAA